MHIEGVLVVVRREYLARVRTKSFWISTLALPLLLAVWVVVPGLVMAKSKTSQRLALVDRTGQVADGLQRELADLARRTVEQVRFDLAVVPAEGNDDELREQLDRRVLAGDIAAWLWIDNELLAEDRVEYHAESVSNFVTQQALESALSSVLRQVRLEGAGYDVETIRRLSRSIDLTTIRISEEGSRAEGGFGGFVLAFALFLVLYTTTLIYGQQVMLGVLEEKNSRVVEVIVSAVHPVALMIGKLLGICLVGLTQLGLWLGAAAALTAPGVVAALAFLPEGLDLPTLAPAIVLHFLLLFLMGYFLYATFYAMLGAAFNSAQEAQQLAWIAVILVVAPWVFFVPVLNDPDSTLAVVTSLIPVFTPFLMMLRIAVKMPPTWQILLAYLLTLALCTAMIWLAARVYRVGILMYGKKPSLRELWRWVRYA